jgi:predicted RNase H-like HicB family nuclease
MNQLVLVRNEPNGQFTGHLVGVPELHATGATREEVIRQIRRLLNEWIASGQLVPIDLPDDNPWLKYAGWAKDDPYEQIYLEELAKAKKEDLERTLKEYEKEDLEGSLKEREQECPNSSSTPTT